MINRTPPISKMDPVSQCIINYKEEAQTGRRIRETLNAQNFDCYNLKQDYSHKRRGQSKDFLPKQATATEHISYSLQQGLMDLGAWFRIGPEDALDPKQMQIRPEEVQKLLERQLEKNNFPNFFNDTIKLGLLGSLMIVKVGGCYKNKPKFEVKDQESDDLGATKKTLWRKDKKVWELELSLVRQEDFFPDPKGSGLYRIERIEMDWHELIKYAKDYPGTFDLKAVMQMTSQIDDLQEGKKSRETNQNVTYSQYRKRVTFYECWGTLLEQNTGEVIMENCVSACDLQGNLIRPPKKNPLWHGKDPYVTCPIIRVPKSVWHKALMDAATRQNMSINELYNLMVDGSMMGVHGIKQLHTSWLEDPSQVSDGIAPGTTLLVNSQCPPGAKVLERVDTAALTQESVTMFNIIDREFQQGSLANDTSLGSMPQRQVKATEVVASNQSLTGIMNGIVKVIEGELVAPLLEKCWLTMTQHMNDLDEKVMGSILGEDRANYISSLSKEELFAATAEKMVYKVFGLSLTLNKIQDFRKIQALLQSIGSSPLMMQEFQRKYSMTKLMGEIIKSLDIDEEKIEMDAQEAAQHQQEQQQAMQMQMMQQSQGNQQGASPNMQSQIPQMSANKGQDMGIAPHRAANNIGMTHPS